MMREAVLLQITQQLKQIETLSSICWFISLLGTVGNRNMSLHNMLCSLMQNNVCTNNVIASVFNSKTYPLYATQCMSFLDIQDIVLFVLQIHGSLFKLFWSIKSNYDTQTLQVIFTKLKNRNHTYQLQTDIHTIGQILRMPAAQKTIASLLDWKDNLHLSQTDHHLHTAINNKIYIKDMNLLHQFTLKQKHMRHLLTHKSRSLFAWQSIQYIDIETIKLQKLCTQTCAWCKLMHKINNESNVDFDLRWFASWMFMAKHIARDTTWSCINDNMPQEWIENKKSQFNEYQSMQVHQDRYKLNTYELQTIYDQIIQDSNAFYSAITQTRLRTYNERFHIQNHPNSNTNTNNNEWQALVMTQIPHANISQQLRIKQFTYFRNRQTSMEFHDALVLAIDENTIVLRLFNPIHQIKLNITDVCKGKYEFATSILSIQPEKQIGLYTPAQTYEILHSKTKLHPDCIDTIAKYSACSLNMFRIQLGSNNTVSAPRLFAKNTDSSSNVCVMFLSPCLTVLAASKYVFTQISSTLPSTNTIAFGIICMHEGSMQKQDIHLFKPYLISNHNTINPLSTEQVHTHQNLHAMTELSIDVDLNSIGHAKIELDFNNTMYNKNNYKLHMISRKTIRSYTVNIRNTSCYLACILKGKPIALTTQQAEFVIERRNLPKKDPQIQVKLPRLADSRYRF